MLLFSFFFLAKPHGFWDPSFLTRDQTLALGNESAVLNTGPPGKSPYVDFTVRKILFKIKVCGTFLAIKWIILHAPSVGGQDWIPSQGSRSHMPQRRSKILLAAAKTQLSQIKKISK